MVKIYKYNNKLAIYLPFDVIKALNLEEAEEVDFFKFNEKAYILAKKSDVTSMLLGDKVEGQQKQEQKAERTDKAEVSPDEIAVLKKLDTMRYNTRTAANIDKILNADEKEILKQLIKSKVIAVFKDPKSGAQLYSISKNIYDKFLMRKRQGQELAEPAKSTPKPSVSRPFQARPEQKWAAEQQPAENENVKKLEKDGYVVIQTEGEAAGLSMSLEESIRRGQVLGTRAFNKKFYIVLRPFMEKKTEIIIKTLRSGEKKVSEVAEETKMDEDAVRSILYLLSENGDVSEKRRDLFVLS